MEKSSALIVPNLGHRLRWCDTSEHRKGPGSVETTTMSQLPQDTNLLPSSDERLRRWRLILGGDECDGIGCSLQGADLAMDSALGALYDSERSGGLGSSAPNVARWLGDIRTYFPASVVRVMQQDAFERLDLRQMLLEPEMLAAVEPDVHLVANLLAL